jgi:hypothetical protein
MKNMIRISMLLGSIIGTFSSCGVQEKTYRQEKHQRIETSKQLGDSKERESDLRNLFANLTKTEHYLWTYSGKLSSLSYTASEKACKDISFDLATEQMLQEALGNEALKKIIEYRTMGPSVFVKGQTSQQSAMVLLCVSPLK